MAKPEYEVILSSRADSMLIEHVRFLSRVSIKSAQSLTAAFKKSYKAIAANPLRYPYADQVDVMNIPHETYRKCLFLKRYKILYLIDGQKVYIDAIIDARQENRDIK